MDLSYRGRRMTIEMHRPRVNPRLLACMVSALAMIGFVACGGNGTTTATREFGAQVQRCEYEKPASGRPVPPGPTTVSGGATCAEALSLYRHGDRGSPWACRSKQPGGRNSPVLRSCTNGPRVARFGGLTP
jgi:hypothetical protein